MQIYAIHREDRPQRLDYLRKELTLAGINAHIFPAIIDKPGWKGCAQSHLKVLEKCGLNETIMILEDDVKFRFPDPMLWIKTAMSDLSLDWDCLYLGGSPQETQEKFTDHLYRARNVKCAHAIIWRNRRRGAVEFILNHQTDIRKIDDYFSQVIQPLFNCYMMRILLCTQTQFKSDTCHRSDVSTIEKNFKLYCK